MKVPPVYPEPGRGSRFRPNPGTVPSYHVGFPNAASLFGEEVGMKQAGIFVEGLPQEKVTTTALT